VLDNINVRVNVAYSAHAVLQVGQMTEQVHSGRCGRQVNTTDAGAQVAEVSRAIDFTRDIEPILMYRVKSSAPICSIDSLSRKNFTKRSITASYLRWGVGLLEGSPVSETKNYRFTASRAGDQA